MKLKITFILFLISFLLNSQNLNKKKFDWDNVFLGGNIGLQFGSLTYIEVAPTIGYNITDKLSSGFGVKYIYLKNKDYNFETDIYGAKIFTRYFVTDNVFAHTEYEYLSLETFDEIPTKRVGVGSLFIGGGYMQRFRSNSGVFILALYNLTESYYTPYSNPIIRIGFVIGL
jgi:hypothetical protein